MQNGFSGDELFRDLTERPALISGPCVIESRASCEAIAETLKTVCEKTGFRFVFKASYDKANRSSLDAFRGPGIEKGLEILESVKEKYRVPLCTDVHETGQVEAVAETVDVIQIPAFLCRQTDLLTAAAATGRIVNLKKGQFLSAKDMRNAVKKVLVAGNGKVMVTERGNSFGYNNLVVDFRNVVEMAEGHPVVMDLTHSVQRTGSLGDRSGGDARFAPSLAYAAAAVGTGIFFAETHPRPDQALSDGPNMIPLDQMEPFLKNLKAFCDTRRTLKKLPPRIALRRETLTPDFHATKKKRDRKGRRQLPQPARQFGSRDSRKGRGNLRERKSEKRHG